MERSTLQRTGRLLFAAALVATLTVTMVTPAGAATKVTCQGQVATTVGTKKADVLYGTKRADVIAGLGGNDVIIGRGGNDIICGGAGADRLRGTAGLDRLYGNAGPDRLFGGNGPDRLFGGGGNDVLLGQDGNDRLNGGPGTDRCTQAPGTGADVSCEPWLVPLSGILAVAYSDIDGLDGYSSGDVMIAELVDASSDGQPGAGDRVVMGRYPLTFDATTFADWGVKTHLAGSVVAKTSSQIQLPTTAGRTLIWTRSPKLWESYYEVVSSPGNITYFTDGLGGSPGEILVSQ